MATHKEFETIFLSDEHDCLAPDGSEVRLLTRVTGGSLCHCTLPEGQVSIPFYHKTIEEIWYFISGEGQMWRKQGEREETVSVRAGVCLTIPPGAAFQFRNEGKGPLEFVDVVMPPWPGPDDEAIPTDGKWDFD